MNTDLYVPLVEKLPDNDLSFGIPQIEEADAQAKRDPGQLTDRQLSILATYAYADAQVYARKRAEARAKAAAPVPAAPRPAAAQARRKYWTADEFDAWTNAVIGFVGADLDLLKDEQVCAEYEKPLTAALEAHYGTPAAAHDMKGLLFPVMLLLQVVARKNRDKREVLEAEVRRLESLLVLQTNEIKSLQTSAHQSLGSTWAGEYESGRTYAAGEVVKRRGTPWLCTRATDAAPGMAPDCWELFYK